MKYKRQTAVLNDGTPQLNTVWSVKGYRQDDWRCGVFNENTRGSNDARSYPEGTHDGQRSWAGQSCTEQSGETSRAITVCQPYHRKGKRVERAAESVCWQARHDHRVLP